MALKVQEQVMYVFFFFDNKVILCPWKWKRYMQVSLNYYLILLEET